MRWGITWGRKATTSKVRPIRHFERTTTQEMANPKMTQMVGTEKNRIALLRRPVMKMPQGTLRKLSKVRVWKAATLGTCMYGVKETQASASSGKTVVIAITA